MLPFPEIDPVALAVGPLAVRWYALAYVGGIVLGWMLLRWLNHRPVPGLPPRILSKQAIDDLMLWAIGGILLGGRLGYVLFYKPGYYLQHPDEILMVWQGGMAFHGGFLGMLIAMAFFCRRYDVRYLALMDLLAVVAPIGLLFGRVANFINGELYGRVVTEGVPWAMIFPHGGPLPRHPSQLYQAGLEGLVLFALLFVLARWTQLREAPGVLSGIFLIGYGVARSIGELFREPDTHLGFLFGPVTMGQLLCIPMALAGVALILWARRQTPKAAT